MNALRVKLIILAVVLLGALCFIYMYGRQSMHDEQTMRHQIVAEDVFDQMEMSLAIFVATEEQRPFNHYRYYYIPADQVRGSVALCRSPLADVPTQGAITSYFHITPEGELQSPHKPLSVQLAKELGDDVVSPRINKALLDNAWTCAILTDTTQKQRQQSQQQQQQQQPSQLPANTSSVVIEKNIIDVNKSNPENIYLAAKGSNRDIIYNSVRYSKDKDNKSKNTQQSLSSFSYQRLQSIQDNDIDRQLVNWNNLRNGNAPLLQDEQQIADIASLELSLGADVNIDVRPMRGMVVQENTMLLYRDVFIADQHYQQGAVLDVAAMQKQLEADVVLTAAMRPHIALTWIAHTDDQQLHLERKNQNSYAYYRRMQAPFAYMGIAVEIDPLPFKAALGPQGLLWVVVALAALCVAGLLMVDRTCALMYAYAQRRQNFVSAVSHELKTPLTAIRMHAEMLSAGMVKDDHTMQRYHQTIHAESERLSRLIDNVLELSRLEKNERTLQLMGGSPVQCIGDAIAMLEPHARELGFELELNIADTVPAVRYERDALVQILLNAVDNAMKFSADSFEKRIVISLAVHEENAVAMNAVAITVRDFGPGVPQEHAQHIFDAFYRGERELTRKTKGTGIGLALVKRLMEEMGGTVTARNCEGQGFELCLQLRLAP